MDPRTTTDVDASGVDRSVPARCVLATRNGQLAGAELRLYQFHSHRTQVPPLRDVALIAWQTQAEIALECGAMRGEAQMNPWDFSILRPGYESRWRWNTSFRAMVLYISGQRLQTMAAEMFDRHVDTVTVRESFQLQDPVIRSAVACLATELGDDRAGAPAYAEALLTQICIHLLRNHAETQLRTPRCPGALSPNQARRVADHVESHLASNLSIEALARVAGISPYHFARLFRKRFDLPPHAYVQQRRIERARELLLRSDLPLKEIVGCTGFYDQSHLTKCIRRVYDTTPAELRKAALRH